MPYFIKTLLGGVLLCVFISACGGGSGDDSDVSEGNSQDNSQENTQDNANHSQSEGEPTEVIYTPGGNNSSSEVPAGTSVLTPFTVKESAEVGSNDFPISVVFPLPLGGYQSTEKLHLTDSQGNAVPAQFEVLNRWWSRDNSIRHVMVHFFPSVDPFNGSDSSGIESYRFITSDSAQAGIVNPVVISEDDTTLEINNQVIGLTIEKSPLKIITPAGELKSLFYDENNNLDQSFLHDQIDIEIEEDGPLRSIVKLSSRTVYTDPETIKHGWAMRIYAYANSPLVRVEFQLQNSAINSRFSAPLFFKGHHLRIETGSIATSSQLRADTPPTADVHSLPLGVLKTSDVNVHIRNFQQTFPNGLSQDSSGNIDIELWPTWSRKFQHDEFVSIDMNWLDDMQHTYKEVLLDFNAARSEVDSNKLAKIFEFPPVPVVPLSYYKETGATFDLGGFVPESSLGAVDNSTNRKPSYAEVEYDLDREHTRYAFGIDNFGLDMDRKLAVASTGGWPTTGQKFYYSGSTADYFDALDYAKGELNIRPQWLAGYTHVDDHELVKPSCNPYSGSTWRHHSGNHEDTLLRGSDDVPEYRQSANPRDDQHAWFYHIEGAYYMSGDRWIYDWYKFMSEFKQKYLHKLDAFPDFSSRSIGHNLAVSMSAYKAIGNAPLKEAINTFVDTHLTDIMKEPHNVKSSSYDYDSESHVEAPFQLGFMLRSLIDFSYEVNGDAEALQIIQDGIEWNYQYANFCYYCSVTSTEPNVGRSGTGLTLVDPIIWYALNTNQHHYAEHAIDYAENESYGDFSGWTGQYESRLYAHYQDLQSGSSGDDENNSSNDDSSNEDSSHEDNSGNDDNNDNANDDNNNDANDNEIINEIADLAPNQLYYAGFLDCGENSCGGITAFSGMLYDPNQHQMVIFGGGHAATMNDDIMRLDLSDFTWKSSYTPTTCSDMTPDNWDGDTSSWTSSGLPAARHTYDMMVISEHSNELILLRPADWQGGYCVTTEDSILGGSGLSHFDFDSNSWSNQQFDYPWSSLGSAEYDPISQDVILVDGNNIYVYDPESLTTIAQIAHRQSELHYDKNLIYYPPLDRFYYFVSGASVFELTVDRDNWSNSTLTEISVSGDIPNFPHTAFAYDQANHLLGGGVSNGKFYAFRPETGEWLSKTIELENPDYQNSWSAQILDSHALDYDPINNIYVFVTTQSAITAQRTWIYRWE
ncbi:MAG: hypothetical protein D6B27_04380 [Gammaproteobacteria bacterium]|nr:MAG: hypothetical protein D6B27_04380 [Gammaproteobacteria bacterium]